MSTEVCLSSSYRLGTEEHELMAGFQLSPFLRREINTHNLVFSDQLDPLLGVVKPIQHPLDNLRATAVDAALGIAYQKTLAKIFNFTDQSTLANSWQWLFASRDTSNQRNPQHQFKLNGIQTVRLAVKSVNGCVDTIIKDIPITSFYDIFAPNAFTPDKTDWNEASVFKPKGRGLKAYRV